MYLSPSPVYPHPLPPKPKSYINPPRLSSIINNIGAGRFTAFKQNQLLLSQIEVSAQGESGLSSYKDFRSISILRMKIFIKLPVAKPYDRAPF